MKRDPRINAKTLTWSSYLAMFLLMAFICSATLVVYISQTGVPEDQLFLFSIVGLVVALSTAGCGMFALIRRHMLRPVRKLSEAAQQVAKGDFPCVSPHSERTAKKTSLKSYSTISTRWPPSLARPKHSKPTFSPMCRMR
ncbi:MAG: HAMP domain-containing protein [Oscillospiraceae bacterium]|nr:HAMP domain-containing protein [Oscillospiraceae bacterium]